MTPPRRRTAFAVATALLALAAPAAEAAPKPPLSHEGRWLTDARGRVVILHGVNMVYKRPPYAPDATGFGADDARFLRRSGFNTVRLGLIYAGVEPQPGSYSRSYLTRIARTERVLSRHRIYSLLDFHQDLYNERFEGEGWPEWAVQDDGLPAEPKNGFPQNYLTMEALNRAYDHFWANDPGPGGVGLQDRYARAWRRVAQRFKRRPFVFGYDLINEPWPGSEYPSCINPAGCPAFDSTTLTEFSNRVIERIREVDRSTLAFYEPLLTFDFGAETHHGDTGDRDAGFSFHVYCLPEAFGGPTGEACRQFEALPFQNADARAASTDDALLVTEFGATDDFARIRSILELSDEHIVGWQYWHYCGCDDPTTSGPGVQAVVVDPARRPRGRNVKRKKLDLLSRPYPQATAGVPLDLSFNGPANRFRMTYSVRRAGGGRFRARPSGRRRRGRPVLSRRSPVTEIFIPPDDYRRRYTVILKGAGLASAPGARVARIAACPGVKRVRVLIRAGRHPHGRRACFVARTRRARRG